MVVLVVSLADPNDRKRVSKTDKEGEVARDTLMFRGDIEYAVRQRHLRCKR